MLEGLLDVRVKSQSAHQKHKLVDLADGGPLFLLLGKNHLEIDK